MKLGTVTYEGVVRQKQHRGPSGKRYRFTGLGTEVESVEDLEYFENRPNYTVEYTAAGSLAKRYSDDYESLKEALSDMGYRQKQKLAKKFGIRADQKSSELEKALEAEAEQLKRQMENQ